jgi:hypothetical protein
MLRMTTPVAAVTLLTCAVTIGVTLGAYTTHGVWGTKAVDFYVNPRNADVSDSAADAAVRFGASVWSDQSRAAFQFVYAGQVTDTSTAYDGRNVVLFRNTTNGGNIASTYSWSSGGVLVDTDIVFWDGGFQMFTGGSSCGGSNAVYIEDIAAHEFGHALGLSHSSVGDATMYSGYSTCSQTQRTLASDDIAGVQALYPPITSSNRAPSVSIYAPGAGVSLVAGSANTFSGAASDPEDGDISSRLTWSSNLSGTIGTGGSFVTALPAGTHVITASVRDSGNLTGSAAVTIVVSPLSEPAPQPSPAPSPDPSGTASLTARGYKVKGLQKADLSWSGLTSATVDVFRNGVLLVTAANTGSRTDAINVKGSGSYTYKVCGAGTSTCTNQVVVGF